MWDYYCFCMEKYVLTLVFVFFCIMGNAASAAVPSKYVLDQKWQYRTPFISKSSHPVGPSGAVVYFRRTFDLKEIPGELAINIAGDKYRLFVNGEYVCRGSEVGTFKRWYFDTVDIAKYLRKGKNVLAIEMVNFGENAPLAFFSNNLGLWVEPNSPSFKFLATQPGNWKCIENGGVRFYPGTENSTRLQSGGGQIIDASKEVTGWNAVDFDDSSWSKPVKLFRASDSRFFGKSPIVLVPRALPMMQESPIRIKSVRRVENLPGVKAGDVKFIEGKKFVVGRNAECKILLDNTELTNAYTRLRVSGGAGARVKIKYCESLFDPKAKGMLGKGKFNRNEIEGKIPFMPVSDIYHLDGRKHEFVSYSFRCFRYVEFEISTKDDPLEISDFDALYTAYPFAEVGRFASSDESHGAIWRAGWRTARLCAWETYFDCPFWERLQYVGDTRIQALISLYVSGDHRLMKKAITVFDDSRISDGITQSRYPNTKAQFIPPFSLFWIGMISDYRKHVDDEPFVAEMLNGIETVVNWYALQIDGRTGMLKPDLPYWNFVDWVDTWKIGVPPESAKSGSSIISLQLACALDDAAVLMEDFGRRDVALRYRKMSSGIKRAVYANCWDAERGLLSDAAGLPRFSQHANIMGILSDAIPALEQRAVFEKIVAQAKSSRAEHKIDDVMEATFYFKFYLFKAAEKVGCGDMFVDMLQPWRDMLNLGLSTFAENPEPTRSDCHAWSASPVYGFLSIVCGVKPSSNGFKSVSITPHLGSLKFARGITAHKNGPIETDYRVLGDGSLSVKIRLPENLDGRFSWRGQARKLHPGLQEFIVKPSNIN